jgi:hypothetical protein
VATAVVQSNRADRLTLALPLLAVTQVQTRVFNMASYGCTQQLPSSRVGFCDVAFRRAIADAKAAGGGVIYWPAGSYILGDPSQVRACYCMRWRG